MEWNEKIRISYKWNYLELRSLIPAPNSSCVGYNPARHFSTRSQHFLFFSHSVGDGEECVMIDENGILEYILL